MFLIKAYRFSCIVKIIFPFLECCVLVYNNSSSTHAYSCKCIETFPFLLAKKTFESEWESIKPVKLTFNRYSTHYVRFGKFFRYSVI